MIYNGQTRAGQFFISLASGFQETRLEILLFFLLIFAFLLFFASYAVVQKRRAHRELRRLSHEILENLLSRLDLNAHEAAILGELAKYLGQGESMRALLVSAHVFDACARNMRLSETVSESQLSALRLKMGFRVMQPEDVPESSTELPEGSPLLLAVGTRTRLRGKLIAQEPGSMLVKLHPGIAPPATGQRFTLYFHNSAGIFSFPTRIIDRREDTVHLEHSSHITRLQRRKYYRRKEFLPIFIRLASTPVLPQESFLLDLGGGGASLQNPRGLFKKGDLLELSFVPEIGKFKLAARVIRVSKNGEVVNVKFESLSDAERNRIMGFLFKQSDRVPA